MPATAEEQRTLMCIALAIKKGEQPASYSKEGARLAKTMSEAQLVDFCESPVAK